MSKRITSQQSKHNILSAAQQLYYHNGFDETSFEEIAEVCGITKPLIRYHYGSKAQLGNEIYGKYTMKQYQVFQEKVDNLTEDYNFLQRLAAYTLLTLRYYKEDEKAFRYYKQFFSCAFTYVTAELESISALPEASVQTEPEITHMHYIGQQYAFRGLLYHYISGEIQCSPELFEKHVISVLIYGNVFKPVDIDMLLNSAHSILEKITVTFAPNFIWE